MAWAISPMGDRVSVTVRNNPIPRAQAERLRNALSDWLEHGDANPFARADHVRIPDPQTEQNRIFEERIKKLEERVFDERAPENDDSGWPEIVVSFLERLGGKR